MNFFRLLLLAIIILGLIWFAIRTISLAVQFGFPAWLLDKTVIAFLLGVCLVAIVKVLAIDPNRGGAK